LKVLPPDRALDPTAAERLLRETRAAVTAEFDPLRGHARFEALLRRMSLAGA
jgi:hypothetical protein